MCYITHYINLSIFNEKYCWHEILLHWTVKMKKSFRKLSILSDRTIPKSNHSDDIEQAVCRGEVTSQHGRQVGRSRAEIGSGHPAHFRSSRGRDASGHASPTLLALILTNWKWWYFALNLDHNTSFKKRFVWIFPLYKFACLSFWKRYNKIGSFEEVIF